jgi:hypothetical protein
VTTVTTVTTGPTGPTAPDLGPDAIAGVARQDIACAPAYLVQVASAVELGEFGRRLDELRAAGQVPAGSHWAETTTSCDIFTSDVNAMVLYSGPYPEPYAACPDRLASPPDAFIKGTTPESSGQVISCACPENPAVLPVLGGVGSGPDGPVGVWTGELQRVLGADLGYDLGDLGSDPDLGGAPAWGVYTSTTAAAVQQFQTDVGLPVTGVVDAATWSAVQAASC